MIPQPVLTAWRRRAPWRDALVEVVQALGMSVAGDDISPARVNVWGEVEVESVAARIRVKFEVNCGDVEPLFDVIRIPHAVETRIWNESASVPTFRPAELVGTKLRALAQRRKGRDLFDLWLARAALEIGDEDLARAGMHYLSEARVSPSRFRERLAEHARDPEFCADVDTLVHEPPDGFEPRSAARELIQWSDRHLDPLFSQQRNPNAVTREQQRWAKEGGWAPGKVRCPEYGIVKGNLARCVHWYEAGGACPEHGCGVP